MHHGFTPAGLCKAATQQLYHPFSTVPYANNQIPVNASSTALVSALYPHVNLPGNTNNYTASFPGNYTLNNGDARIDENFNEKHHLWIRYGGKNALAATSIMRSTSFLADGRSPVSSAGSPSFAPHASSPSFHL